MLGRNRSHERREAAQWAIQGHAAIDAALERRIARDGDKGIMRHATRLYSQNFEDAILAEIFERLQIEKGHFVEIGVESGEECNSRLLLEQGWSGLWIEGDPEGVRKAQASFAREIEDGRLSIVQAFVTPETVNDLLPAFPGEIDFLSVDVDMQTHTIWRAIDRRVRVSCIEYNASVPPTVDWAVQADGPQVWQGDTLFGASLRHMERIGREKSARLVGCDLMGVNAFFVDEAIAGDRFHTRTDAAFHFQPPRYEFARVPSGHPRARRG